MSVDSVRKNRPSALRLYKSAFLSKTLNFALATNSFNSVADIDVSKLDPDKLEIFVYGHRLDSSQDYATIPNQGTLALVNSNVLFAAWRLVGGTLQIGFVNPNPGFTPSAPFVTAYLSYFIFTH